MIYHYYVEVNTANYNNNFFNLQRQTRFKFFTKNNNFFCSKFFLFILISLFFQLKKVDAKFCYSCAGICHNEHHCNCQMGSCKADYCFIEKRPADINGLFRITKGCIKKPSRTRPGCDYDHYPNHIQCVCAGEFCNDAILMRRNSIIYPRRNVTCRECNDRNADCGGTCRGEWCHEKVSSGGAGCGYGPPVLPYFYRSAELLRHNGKICVTLSRGNAAPQKYCICDSHMCNNIRHHKHSSFLLSSNVNNEIESSSRSNYLVQTQFKSRSIINQYRKLNAESNHLTPIKYYECINCDLKAEKNLLTSNCKQNRCYGQFCIYATQRVFINGAASTVSNNIPLNAQAIVYEKQACMNVTDFNYVQLGCTHKWMNNEEEELYCACRGNHCNIDLVTAAASASLSNWNETIKTMFLKTLLLIFAINIT